MKILMVSKDCTQKKLFKVDTTGSNKASLPTLFVVVDNIKQYWIRTSWQQNIIEPCSDQPWTSNIFLLCSYVHMREALYKEGEFIG